MLEMSRSITFYTRVLSSPTRSLLAGHIPYEHMLMLIMLSVRGKGSRMFGTFLVAQNGSKNWYVYSHVRKREVAF